MGCRKIGYNLLPGRSFDYLLHLRPMEWPVVSAHMLTGFLVATGLSPGSWDLGSLALSLIAWVLLLNGGTLALNRHFDRDVGDIGYLQSPPAPPRYLGVFGATLMMAGAVPAYLVSREFLLVYGICVFMSFLYSCPPLRLKAVGGMDLIINALGFGSLTFLAGSLAYSSVLGTPILFFAGGFFLLFAGFYPLTQLYQYDEDLQRGDRTLVVAIGKKRGMEIAIAGVVLAFALFFIGANWRSLNALSLVLVLPLIAWGYVVIPWRVSIERASQESNKRGMYKALWVWALTDLSVIAWAVAGKI